LNKRDLQRFKKLLLEQRDQIQGNAKKTLSGDIHVDPDDCSPAACASASTDCSPRSTRRW
jgi:hypothetical protein